MVDVVSFFVLRKVSVSMCVCLFFEPRCIVEFFLNLSFSEPVVDFIEQYLSACCIFKKYILT